MSDSWSELATSRFFKAEEVKEVPVVHVIKSITKEKVEFQGKPPEALAIIRFEDTDREMIAKNDVQNFLKENFGVPSACVGKAVELYFDKTVKFGGKSVGGLRLRQPSGDQGPAF